MVQSEEITGPTKIPVKFVLMEGNFGEAVELHFGPWPGGYAWMFLNQWSRYWPWNPEKFLKR